MNVASKVGVAVLAAALLLPGLGVAHSGSGQEEAVALRRAAVADAYLGASLVLECLADAKDGASSSLRKARETLLSSKLKFEKFTKLDRADAPLPKNLNEAWYELIDKIVVKLAMVGIEVELTEKGVARANVQALHRIIEQIGSWENCGAVVEQPGELLVLLENKIALERTTQLAEAAWDGPF